MRKVLFRIISKKKRKQQKKSANSKKIASKYLLIALVSDSKCIGFETVGALFSNSTTKSGSNVDRGRDLAWNCIFCVRRGEYELLALNLYLQGASREEICIVIHCCMYDWTQKLMQVIDWNRKFQTDLWVLLIFFNLKFGLLHDVSAVTHERLQLELFEL